MNNKNKADMEEHTETNLSAKLVFSAIEGDGEAMRTIGDMLWEGEGLGKTKSEHSNGML